MLHKRLRRLYPSKCISLVIYTQIHIRTHALDQVIQFQQVVLMMQRITDIICVRIHIRTRLKVKCLGRGNIVDAVVGHNYTSIVSGQNILM